MPGRSDEMLSYICIIKIDITLILVPRTTRWPQLWELRHRLDQSEINLSYTQLQRSILGYRPVLTPTQLEMRRELSPYTLARILRKGCDLSVRTLPP